ncbi:hypothetical protein DFH06DRAFT_1347730 [Mycena polygramma]|nr:hypothetical protein DFH06DRAFT_1347730 [Mycena polygramma]
MGHIVEFPQDVLLELAKLLKFDDLASLLSLCRTIRELQGHKPLWLDALHKIKEVENQPLPFTTWEALDALTAQELQDIAWRAIRLMKTWRSDAQPRPVHIRTLDVEAGANF